MYCILLKETGEIKGMVKAPNHLRSNKALSNWAASLLTENKDITKGMLVTVHAVMEKVKDGQS